MPASSVRSAPAITWPRLVPAGAMLFLVAACSSSSSSPFPADAGDAARDGAVSSDTADEEPIDATDAGSATDASVGSGLRCYVTSGSCICLDPAPEGYTATSCPSMPCCWRSEGAPRECACATFEGAACDEWRSGPAVASCP